MLVANPNNSLAIVVLAAGKGKRMLNPELPKVLAKINNKPLIAFVLDTAFLLNPKEIAIVVGFHKNLVVDFVNNYSNKPVKFVEQKEQLGTGHAVAQTESILGEFDGDVLILCGDVPFLEHKTLTNFINNFKTNNADLSVLTTIADNPSGYGRIVRDYNGVFIKIVEEKDADQNQKNIKEINSGVFIIKAMYLFPALKRLKNQNAQGEYYLTDIIEILIADGRRVTAFPGAEFQELQGINSPYELEMAQNFLNSKKI